jgi:sterol 14-demethylase
MWLLSDYFAPGRHPCAGMRAAKLEMKLLVSLFILSFEYKLVDASGNFPNPLPQANRNDIHEVSFANCRAELCFSRAVLHRLVQLGSLAISITNELQLE